MLISVIVSLLHQTCKHTLALHLILKEFYHSLNNEVPLPSNANEEPTFKSIIENVYGEDSMNECALQNTQSKDLLQVINDMKSMLVVVKTNIEKYGEIEMKHKVDAIKG